MRPETVPRVFPDGEVGGTPAAVVREAAAPGPSTPVTAAVAVEPDPSGAWPVRFLVESGELPFSTHAALAAAAALADEAGTRLRLATPAGRVQAERDGGTWWVTPPKVGLLNWAQPAFAARAVTLDPLELDSRHLPGGVAAPVPYLVVPVEGPDVLAKAEFAHWRLRDLLPRLGCDAAVAFAEVPDGGFRMRAFPEAYGLPEEAGAGDAAAAVAGWLLDNDELPEGAAEVRLTQGNPRGPAFEVRVRACHGEAGPEVRVGGRVLDG